MTASLRATAMAACMKPILSRSTRPHVRRVLLVDLRVSMTVSHLVEKPAQMTIAAQEMWPS